MHPKVCTILKIFDTFDNSPEINKSLLPTVLDLVPIPYELFRSEGKTHESSPRSRQISNACIPKMMKRRGSGKTEWHSHDYRVKSPTCKFPIVVNSTGRFPRREIEDSLLDGVDCGISPIAVAALASNYSAKKDTNAKRSHALIGRGKRLGPGARRTTSTGTRSFGGLCGDFFHRRRESFARGQRVYAGSVIYTRRGPGTGCRGGTGEPQEGQKGRAVHLARA